MNTPLAAQRDRLSALTRGYSPMQMVIAGLLAALVAVGGFLAVRAATAPEMGVLYANLSQEDAAAVTDQLTAAGVSYELSQGGTTIMVPVEQVDATRLDMAGQGLPKTSVVGYELLDAQSLTTSSFREQVNYQRALEGELARTLMSMDGVESASVRLVMPEERLFSTQSRPASAAVQLTTSQPLSEEQVRAVVHLVASSVPDLAPENVTVTDSTGQLLAGGDLSSSASAPDQLQASVEARLSASADSMLSQVLGPDMAVVRVAAEISRDDQVQQSEVYDPTRMAAGAEKTVQEQYQASETSTGTGAVTTQPDPANPAAGGDSSTTNYTNNTTETDNLVSRTVTEVKTPPGEVARLTVAVAVDESVTTDVAQIEQLVGNAVGLDTGRGDTIVVTKMPFVDPEEVAPVEVPAPIAGGMLPTIIGGVLLALISLGLLLRLRGRRSPLDPSELAAAGMLQAEPSPVEHRANRTEADQLRDRIDGSPQEAANVLRGWLAEDATRSR